MTELMPGAGSIDLGRARLHLVPGTSDPNVGKLKGMDVGRGPDVHQERLLAVFNGGFQANHGRWGMMVDGVWHAEAPLAELQHAYAKYVHFLRRSQDQTDSDISRERLKVPPPSPFLVKKAFTKAHAGPMRLCDPVPATYQVVRIRPSGSGR